MLFLVRYLPCFFMTGFLTGPGACQLCLTDWPVNPRDLLVYLPSLGITCIYCHAHLFTWVVGFEPRSSYLHGKQFPS